jgi:small-conductance mechanosensitive channel
MEISVRESAPNHPNRFLAALTQAMRVTSDSALQASVEQCRADAKTYVEQIQARTDDEVAAMHAAAEADSNTIRERSKADVARVRSETEQRVARRRELLQQELQEYDAAIELEVERVQERVLAFQEEVSHFFDQLLQGADPTVFARMATQMPDPPDFMDRDREVLAKELRARREQLAKAEAEEAAAAARAHS